MQMLCKQYFRKLKNPKFGLNGGQGQGQGQNKSLEAREQALSRLKISIIADIVTVLFNLDKCLKSHVSISHKKLFPLLCVHEA